MKDYQILKEAFSWFWTQGWWTVPLFGIILLIVIKIRPQLIQGLFGYQQKFNDFSKETGPFLHPPERIKLEQLAKKQSAVATGKAKIYGFLSRLYDQPAMQFSGFNRALLIAFFYPIALIMLFWLFSDGALRLGNAEIAEPAAFSSKLWLLSVAVFFAITLFYADKLGSHIVNAVAKVENNNSMIKVMLKKLAVFLGNNFNQVLIFTAVAYIVMVALTGGIAVAFAGAVAFAFAGAGAGAFAGAFAGAGAVAVAVAVAVAGAVAFAGAGAFAVAVAFLVFMQYDKLATSSSRLYQFIAYWALFGYLAVMITAPLWAGAIVTFEQSKLSSAGLSFAYMFFLAALPFVNATSDWLSVSFTQFCLSRYNMSRYSKGQSNWWVWLLLDLTVALLLLVVVIGSVFGLLYVFQYAGWDIDANSILNNFAVDPFAGEHIWLLALVLTNLMPTLLHLVFVAVALVSGWFDPVTQQVEGLLKKADLAAKLNDKSRAKHNPKDYQWGEQHARDVAFYLTGMPVIQSILVVSFLFPFSYGAYYAVNHLIEEIITWLI